MMNTDWNPWRSLIVLQVAVLLVGCGVIASFWRGIEFVIDREEKSQVELERFHTESIAAIRELATNAGALTSAELCPVRFRLRLGEGHSIPSLAGGNTTFRLWAQSETHRDPVMTATMNPAGTLDFGLNPPGTYQLELQMPDGMLLQHQFDVLPGVPVDRLIYCPRPAFPDNILVKVDIDWPDRLRTNPPLAVCHIEPASYIRGEWTWEPPPEWKSIQAPAQPYNPYQWECLLDSGRGVSLGDTFLTVEQPRIEYLHCQISEIDFFVDAASGRQRPEMIHLATVCFSCAGRRGESPVSTGSIWDFNVPPPQFDNDFGHTQITLPPEVNLLLEELMSRQL